PPGLKYETLRTYAARRRPMSDKVHLSNVELLAKGAENYPAIFGPINLTNIREQTREILKLVGRDGIFREYTLHDSTHVDALLALVERLVPEQTAKQMTTADWLLIVLACYFHDLGMLVTKQEFADRDNNPEYLQFRENLLAGEKGQDYAGGLADLSSEKRDEFFYQEFVRKMHAKRIFYWVQGQNAIQFGNAGQAVEALNDLLNPLEGIVRDDLARICLSHHEDDLFDLDKYPISRVYGDDPQAEANIHYASLILRTADVLQIQKRRVPSVLYKLIDPSNPKSQEEWAKQAGVRAVRPRGSDNGKQDTIEVHASFEKESGYFGLLAYIQQYASKELEKCWDWARLATKKGAKHSYPWRFIDSSQVEPRGFETKPYSFQLDHEKILKLLTGHTLYNDSTVAIREVVQNSLDAVRFRSYTNPGEPMRSIEVTWDSTNKILAVRDTGTGMTQEVIERFLLNVGASFYQSEGVLQKYTSFAPISRFGIGILSTFMMADQVEILTVHPDEEWARLLTLPSVVKNYLGRKLPKGDPRVQKIGPHGTEVTLHVRSSAKAVDIEKILKFWVVLPGCPVTCRVDDGEDIRIGFSDLRNALQHYWEKEMESSRLPRDIELHLGEMPGISVAYMVETSRHSDTWSFVRRREEESYWSDVTEEDETAELDTRPGVLVEGIRISSTPLGFEGPGEPWILVNLTGKEAPRTNVARLDLEQTAELLISAGQTYEILLGHVKDEFERLERGGAGLLRAAEEANHMWVFGLKDIRYRSIFEEKIGRLSIAVIESGGTLETVARIKIEKMSEVWTTDSPLLRSLEKLCGYMGVDLPAERVVEILGGALEQPIPSPRLLTQAVEPLANMEVAAFRFPEFRRIDLCWKTVNGRWVKLPPNVLRSSEYHRFGSDIWIAKSPEILVEHGDYEIVFWREKIFILPKSPILQ